MKHIVALSGGKDSTAMALRLRELNPGTDYMYVCTPTGDELPEMLAHWDDLERRLEKPILKLSSKQNLDGLIAKFSALPNHRMRWCTRILKIEPFKKFYDEHAPCISYVGLRADEESRRGGVFGEGVEQRFPMREWGWTLADVQQFLRDRDVAIPARTDCARCYHQRLNEWWELHREYPDIYASAEQQEETTGYTFRSAHRDTWPADLKGLREEFESGRVPQGTRLQADFWAEDNPVCRVCSL